jgi:hypothetical protein
VNDYCSPTDIQNRLTDAGYKWAGDRRGKGLVTPDQIIAYVQPSIDRAGSDIDEIVGQAMPVEVARSQAAAGCPWLKFRAIDIATYYFVSGGGRGATKVIETAYEETLSKLASVDHDTNRIPGLIYPPPPMGRMRSAVFPMAHNYR